MSQPYIGEIRAFGFNFAPSNWAFCNGQLMSIAQNNALFAVIGTTYGGDGVQTFALPNLQGQIPMHWGTGPGGFTTVIGQAQGVSTVTLTTNQMPAHTHQIVAVDSSDPSERTASPSATSFISGAKGAAVYQKPPVTPTATFSPKAIMSAGGSQPHDNMQPYLTINFCMALQGIFPQQG